MKKLVLINTDFLDVYTGKLHKAGDKEEMTAERIAEIKSVNPEFVSVIGSVEEPEQAEQAEATESVEPVEEPKQPGKKAVKKS